MKKYFILTSIIIFLVNASLSGRIINASQDDIIKIIEKAKKGDVINLNPGIYKTNLILSDGISITSIDKINTVIESQDTEKYSIIKYGSGIIENITIINGIYATNSDAVIQNNIIKNSNHHGIQTAFFNGKIINNIIENNKLDGIKCYNSNATITNNVISSNEDDGIQVLHSSLVIDSNLIANNRNNGVEFWFDDKTEVKNNTFIQNENAFKFIVGNKNANFIDNTVNNEVIKVIPDRVEQARDEITRERQIIPSFITDTEGINDALYYIMLKLADFNLDHRIEKSDIDLPVFLNLFSNTLNTGKYIKGFADKLSETVCISYKIDNILSIDSLAPFRTMDATECREIKLPKKYPLELKNYINQIYQLTEMYYEEYNKVKSKLKDEEWDFINDKIKHIFTVKRPLSLTLKEELRQKDEDDKEELKLKMLFEKIDLTKLQIIGYNIIRIAEKIKEIDFSKINNKTNFNKKTPFGEIRICTEDNNPHLNSDCFILIDISGDDVYKNNIANSNENKPVSLYFDLKGNDNYTSDNNFDIASAYFGISYIYDKEGNDRYVAKNNSIAAAYFGMSIIDDNSGDDYYECNNYGISSAMFGVSILQDLNGNDVYKAGTYCQGFGLTKGYGIIFDREGSDNYLSGNTMADAIRNEAHSITMSQGFGYGIRPHISGGLGLIIDKSGNDLYKSDVFGQGGAYFLSIGGLIDYSGDDDYISYSYSQGAGVHLGIGALIDIAGNDEYTSHNVSQGMGLDMSFGLLCDLSGDDFYKIHDFGQAAGYANGIGLLIEESGNDAYFAYGKDTGYGEYFIDREFGSIGIFYDKSGDDTYQRAKNNSIQRKDRYGLFYDK
ncbi:MAG: right-handed parallel beta-helix repeat-containing protein [Candidatus Hydrogenedentota bacterium]